MPLRALPIAMLGLAMLCTLPAARCQSRWSLQGGMGTNYLPSATPFHGGEVWHNARVGFPLQAGLEYHARFWWAGLQLQGGRQRWETGPGSMIWPGRNKPVRISHDWWNAQLQAMLGASIALRQDQRIRLLPYVGAGYDYQTLRRHCAVGATLNPPVGVPIAYGEVQSTNTASLLAGGGVNLDIAMIDGANPVWLRMGLAGWWRQQPLAQAAYHYWDDGGRMVQIPPFGTSQPRPGQTISLQECPDQVFSAMPDYSEEFSIPGHSLQLTFALRFEL